MLFEGAAKIKGSEMAVTAGMTEGSHALKEELGIRGSISSGGGAIVCRRPSERGLFQP